MRKEFVWSIGIVFIVSANGFAQFAKENDHSGGIVSVTKADGIKTTRVRENSESFVIRESDHKIEFEFINVYGPKKWGELKKRHPDLHMHISSFPKTSEGAIVEVEVKVARKIVARNEAVLRKKSEKAFKVFEKYKKPSDEMMFELEETLKEFIHF